MNALESRAQRYMDSRLFSRSSNKKDGTTKKVKPAIRNLVKLYEVSKFE